GTQRHFSQSIAHKASYNLGKVGISTGCYVALQSTHGWNAPGAAEVKELRPGSVGQTYRPAIGGG
ncbi:hypothetical protein, partial [Spirosoma flavus]